MPLPHSGRKPGGQSGQAVDRQFESCRMLFEERVWYFSQRVVAAARYTSHWIRARNIE